MPPASDRIQGDAPWRFNDLMAIGLMQAAAAAGTRTSPGALSVGGLRRHLRQRADLPTADDRAAQLELAGERAVEKVLARLEEGRDAIDDGLLATTLVVRGSTGPRA